jgi:hypothetical protein
MVTNSDAGDAFADRLHDATALVAEDTGEQTLRVCMSPSVYLAWECELTSGSLPLRVYSSVWQIPSRRDPLIKCRPGWQKRYRTGVEDLNADLVRFGRGDLDILKGEWLAGSPAHSGLAGDRLSCRVRHFSVCGLIDG